MSNSGIRCGSKRAYKIRRIYLVQLIVLDVMVSKVARCWLDYVRMFRGMRDLYLELARMIPVCWFVFWVLLVSESVVTPLVA